MGLLLHIVLALFLSLGRIGILLVLGPLSLDLDIFCRFRGGRLLVCRRRMLRGIFGLHLISLLVQTFFLIDAVCVCMCVCVCVCVCMYGCDVGMEETN